MPGLGHDRFCGGEGEVVSAFATIKVAKCKRPGRVITKGKESLSLVQAIEEH